MWYGAGSGCASSSQGTLIELNDGCLAQGAAPDPDSNYFVCKGGAGGGTGAAACSSEVWEALSTGSVPTEAQICMGGSACASLLAGFPSSLGLSVPASCGGGGIGDGGSGPVDTSQTCQLSSEQVGKKCACQHVAGASQPVLTCIG